MLVSLILGSCGIVRAGVGCADSPTRRRILGKGSAEARTVSSQIFSRQWRTSGSTSGCLCRNFQRRTRGGQQGTHVKVSSIACRKLFDRPVLLRNALSTIVNGSFSFLLDPSSSNTISGAARSWTAARTGRDRRRLSASRRWTRRDESVHMTAKK